MPIFSHSNDKDVFLYCSDWLISIEDTEIWNHTNGAIDQTHPDAGIAANLIGNYRALRVPNFQRGIEWDFQTLWECLTSRSRTLGIVVFGRTNNIPNVEFIIDGLQRFASFTYLLHRLDSILFQRPVANNPNPWNLHPTLATRQSLTNVQNIAAARIGIRGRIQYNHAALRLMRRQAVSQTYRAWCDKADAEIEKLLNPQNQHFQLGRSEVFFDALADFVAKPLFTQELSNFVNVSELLATFRGMNSIRVELTGADVCRSVVVDGMIGGQAGPQDVLKIDNDFNNTLLTPTGRVQKGLAPLVKVLEHEWTDSQHPALVPSIFAVPLVAANIQVQFNEFISWVNIFDIFRSSSNYLDFIADIGDNPYVATLLYYFHRHRAAGTLTTPPPEAELHQIAVAYFRLLLDKGVGDTLPLTKLAGSNDLPTLADFLQRINPQRAGPLSGPPTPMWLQLALNDVRGPGTATVAFNACLLPVIHGNNPQAFGSPFNPTTFGRGANNWQIDHLIPQNSFRPLLSPGDPFKDSLRNFCPIIGSDNAAYNARDCAQKLDLATANLATYRTDARKMPGGNVHPFIEALLTRQGANGGNAELNQRDWLINPTPVPGNRCYGDERIEILVRLLQDRI
jgi:hypothetical protein